MQVLSREFSLYYSIKADKSASATGGFDFLPLSKHTSIQLSSQYNYYFPQSNSLRLKQKISNCMRKQDKACLSKILSYCQIMQSIALKS